jgi:hypothetical protein
VDADAIHGPLSLAMLKASRQVGQIKPKIGVRELHIADYRRHQLIRSQNFLTYDVSAGISDRQAIVSNFKFKIVGNAHRSDIQCPPFQYSEVIIKMLQSAIDHLPKEILHASVALLADR